MAWRGGASGRGGEGGVEPSLFIPPERNPEPPAEAEVPAEARSKRRLWIPLVAGAAAVVVVGAVIAFGALVHERDEPAVARGPAVTGLKAEVKGIAVDLTWTPFPGADSYRLYRDPQTEGQAVSVVKRNRATDRPGDDAEHTYSVVALARGAVAGQPAEMVRAQAAAPYQGAQPIASAWPRLVPEEQGAKGEQGQVCRTQGLVSQFSNGEIRCVFPGGVRVQVLRYDSADVRERRVEMLAAQGGARSRTWKAQGLSGHVLGTDARTPWRFWTFDQRPAFAVYASWPGHSGAELETWWEKRAPLG